MPNPKDKNSKEQQCERAMFTHPLAFSSPGPTHTAPLRSPRALELSGLHPSLPFGPSSPLAFHPAQPPRCSQPNINPGLVLTPFQSVTLWCHGAQTLAAGSQTRVQLASHPTYAPLGASIHITGFSGIPCRHLVPSLSGLPEWALLRALLT